MGTGNYPWTSLVLDAAIGLVYLAVLVLTVRRQTGRQSPTFLLNWVSPAFWLTGYALLSLALHVLLMAGRQGWLPWMDVVNRLRIDQSAAVLLALFLFMGLRTSLPPLPPKTQSAPHKKFKEELKNTGLVKAEGSGSANNKDRPSKEKNETDYQTILNKDRRLAGVSFLASLVFTGAALAVQNYTLIFFAWLFFSLITVVYLFHLMRQPRPPFQRGQLFFWLPILILAIANELILFYQIGSMEGDYLRALALLALAYVMLSLHPPEPREIARLLIYYLLSALLIGALYLGGFWLINYLLPGLTTQQMVFAGAGIAAVVSLLFVLPISKIIRETVNRLYQVRDYDAAQILHTYSLAISNILDLDKLAEIAIGTIRLALDIDKGTLYLVDQEIDEHGEHVFRLNEVGDKGSPIAASLQDTLRNPLATSTSRTKKLNTITLAEDSVIARYLREKHQSLLQDKLDYSLDFVDAPIVERAWFSKLKMDVYVPIISKNEWLGLLALGSRLARRYTPTDLNALGAIASQTGVALENARLVENLRKLNIQVREAYAFLDKANHDLAKLEMTKSNFISIASHELRTPLTTIKGYTEMLLEDPSLGVDMQVFIKGIHKSTLRLHEVMDSMFDVAQMDSRAIELQRQDVFVTEMVRSVSQELSKFANEREQELNLDLPQLPTIKADPNTIRKLFHHLIINAIKFTPNKGKITVTGKHLAPNNRDLPEGGVEIVVADTGVGVDKNYQEVIFTKFYQPGELLNRHSTGKTKFKGSGVGLGLALSRGIVEAHGGKIWVVSPGYDEENFPGSEFHVILPSRSQGESKTVRMGSAVKLKL